MMKLLFILFHILSLTSAQSLNSLLQDYSFRAFTHPRTGILYDATVPTNLTGIKLSGMRLRNGSLRKRGVSSIKEFTIPTGVIVTPYVTRLILVYHNLANYSQFYYPLPGYDYLAPVLGLLAYDAKNLTAVNLPELDLKASNDPIRINFSDLERVPQEGVGGDVKCVRFGSDSEVSFSDLKSGSNVCETDVQGHFSVVVKSVTSAPSERRKSSDKTRTWVIVGSVVGGLILLSLLVLVVMRCLSYKKKEKMREMERVGEREEALRMTQVGETRAPTATSTRTQPMLETEYSS